MSNDFMRSQAAIDAAKAFAEQRRERLRAALETMREGIDAAEKLTAREEEERASVVRRQAEALVELIDQRIDDALVVQGVVRAGLVRNALQKTAQLLERLGIALFHQGQRGDLQVALRRDLALQKAVAIFEHLHAVLDGHFQGSSSDNSNNPDATPADPADHRLCEERI